MVIENNIKNSKLKLPSEKRGKEEIKEHLDKYGIMRAKYKEEMNNKYELRSVINMYVNSNEFTSPLLEKYKLKKSSLRKGKSVFNSNDVDFNQTMNTPMKKFSVGISSFTQKNESAKKVIHSNKDLEELEKVLDDNRIEMISPGI